MTLDLDAGLRAMNGPLLAWYEEHARILPWRKPGRLPCLDLGDHAAADQGRSGQTLF